MTGITPVRPSWNG